MLLSLFLGCSMLADNFGSPADSSDTTEIIFEVPKGTMARSLGAGLSKADVVDSADNFNNYVKITKEGSCIKAGKFALTRSMSAKEILETLCGVPIANDKPFTVVEGWRIREIDAALTTKGWIKAGEYAKLANDPSLFTASFELPDDSLEGYLYPETYMLSPDRFDAQKFIQRQLNVLDDNFYTPNKDAIQKSKRSFDELMIMGSMLEREEPKKKNRPLVAGIIWKRLDNSWNLGIDATSHYGLEDWNDRKGLLKALRNTKDPYNTRLRSGLPPTPIGAPSVGSLEAALHPEASAYWYYLHDSKQNIHPAKNAAGHEANRRKYNVY